MSDLTIQKVFIKLLRELDKTTFPVTLKTELASHVVRHLGPDSYRQDSPDDPLHRGGFELCPVCQRAMGIVCTGGDYKTDCIVCSGEAEDIAISIIMGNDCPCENCKKGREYGQED